MENNLPESQFQNKSWYGDTEDNFQYFSQKDLPYRSLVSIGVTNSDTECLLSEGLPFPEIEQSVIQESDDNEVNPSFRHDGERQQAGKKSHPYANENEINDRVKKF